MQSLKFMYFVDHEKWSWHKITHRFCVNLISHDLQNTWISNFACVVGGQCTYTFFFIFVFFTKTQNSIFLCSQRTVIFVEEVLWYLKYLAINLNHCLLAYVYKVSPLVCLSCLNAHLLLQCSFVCLFVFFSSTILLPILLLAHLCVFW